MSAMSATTLDRIAIATLALVALIAALTFRDYGLGWDDYTHSQYADLLLAFYGSGFADRRALEFVNLYLYGGGFDMAAALIAKVLPFDLFETRRLAGAAVGILGLAVTWRIARRIGGPVSGLMALLLLATCPLWYGHMFINPKDAPFAVAMAVLLLGLVRAFEEYPKPSWPTVVILALGFGLSIGSRIMGGFGMIYLLGGAALLLAADTRANGLRFAGKLFVPFAWRIAAAAAIAYGVMALVWPWGVIDPLNPLRAIAVFSTFFEKPWQELFEGALLTPPEMPRRYVPELLGLQLAVVFSLFGLVGTTGMLSAVVRATVPTRQRAIYLAVALAALLPVLIAVASRPAMYNGVRHFLFVLPPLAVAAGVAAAWALEPSRSGLLRIATAAMLAVGLALQTVQMVRLHPFQYANFNLVIGGISGARSGFMLDYWGLSLKQAAQALKARLAERGEMPPTGRRWKVAVCGPHPGVRIELGDAFEPTWDAKGADFALMLGEFYCARLDAPVIASINRAGVTFARVYDIRGWDVPNLFSIPPIEREEPPLPTR